MYEYIRNLRHNKIFSHIFIWKVLGYCFRITIANLPFNFAVKQNITKNFTFRMHAKFAFSNFKEWGNNHNNFFKIIDKLRYKIYDQNFVKPTEMENSEYLIVPKSFNLKKFIND